MEKISDESDRSWDSDSTLVTEMNERMRLDSKGKLVLIGSSGCYELVASNAAILHATPSIHLHTSGCACKQHQPKFQAQDDDALARRITAVTRLFKAREQAAANSAASSPTTGVATAFASLSRWFASSVAAAPDPDKVADLCNACAALDVDQVASLLLDDHVPANSRLATTTPLIAAVRAASRQTRPKAHLAMLALLIEAGADVNAVAGTVSEMGGTTVTPLSAASALGLTGAVRLLLDRGASVGAANSTLPMRGFTGHSMTALHAAVFSDRLECVELLLRRGADVRATFDAHNQHQRPQTTTQRQRGAPPLARSHRAHRRTWTANVGVLHLVASAACAEVLLRYGADLGARDGLGRMPLHWAAEAGRGDLVGTLLDAGASADALDDDGASPLAVVCARLEEAAMGRSRKGKQDKGPDGYVEVVRLLLRAGANPEQRYPGDVSLRARMLGLEVMESGKRVYGEMFEQWRAARLQTCSN